MKYPDMLGRGLASLILLGCTCFSASGQTPSFSVSPAIITNDFTGKIVLSISNLNAGQTVIIEKFADVNGNGVIELGQELMMRRFKVTDGALPLIGGARNVNVPGDDDGAVNGRLRVELNYPGLDQTLDHIAGQFLYRLVDPLGVFSPVVTSVTVRQKAYSQGVSGIVRATGTGQVLSNAVVVLVVQQGNGGAGTFTDSNGYFSISNAPGDYVLVTVKNGFVADQAAGLVTISSNSFVTKNLTNPVANQTLSGKVSDSGTSQGLAAILVQAESTNNLMAIGFTDTNGNFSLGSTASEWKVKVNQDSGLSQARYVGIQNNPTRTNTFGGSVSGINFQFPQATALIYGHVFDNLSQAVSDLGILTEDSSYAYEAGGRSTTNGSYSTAVFAGDWQVGPIGDELATDGLLGQSVQVTVTNGQALLQDIHVQKATAHLRGRVVNGTGVPIGNIQLVVNLITGSGPSPVNLSPQTLGDGTFDVGVFGGNWNLALECQSASERGLVNPNISLTVVDGVDRTNLTLIAPIATGYITGTIQDNNGNPVNATTYASLFLNGTNYNVCGGNGGSSFSMAVFNGAWQIGISGDMTSRGYDNPPNQSVTVTGTNSTANIVLYPLGRTPPRLTGGTYGNGQFQLILTGNPDAMYRIEMTTNLSNPASWAALRTNTAFGGTFTFLDTNAPRVPPRFYRAVLAQ